jgi:hypothetical protein
MIEPMERLPDPPCEACHKHPEDCRCPECPTCGNQGCSGCAPAAPVDEVAAGMAKLRERFLAGADDILQWSGCFSGDCPHTKAVECEAAVYEVGKQVAAEFLQDAAPGPSDHPGSASTGEASHG